MKTNQTNKSGVALIMVIGLLALMMVMAVAFAVYMRTERVAAGAFLNDVRAREFLHVAMARALADLETNLGNRPYPDWDIMVSTNGSVNIDGVTNSPALEWIPRAPLSAGITPWPVWTNIARSVTGGREQGRIGYMIVNCSGLLDANYSGDGVAGRNFGTNVCEIQLANNCPEVANVGLLVAGRTPEKYETIQELNQVGMASGALSQPVANFTCFSYFPTGYVGGTNNFLCDISGDENALLLRYHEITNALVQSGIPQSQADFVFTNLLDYVDTNCIPHDLGSACTESVPMFNEIGVTNRCRFLSNTNVIVKPDLYVEWFYPFVKAISNTFWITWTVSWTTISPAGFPPPPNASGALDAGYSVGGVVPCYNFLDIPLPAITNSYAAAVGQPMTLKASITLQMRQGSASGEMVDATPFPTNLTHNMTVGPIIMPAPPVAGFSSGGAYYGVEAVDPRFNWLQSPPEATGQWRVPLGQPNTLGGPNTVMLSAFSARDTDGYPDMFVADRPLTSVTELTYILRGGKPRYSDSPPDQWNTIRLYDTVSPIASRPLDRVLDHFFIPTTGYGKGLVNPNTSASQVLAAVLQGMPVDGYPGQPFGNSYSGQTTPAFTLSPAQAMNIASHWSDTNQNQWRGYFTNLSDIGHATNIFGVAPLAGLSAFQQESLFRYTAGLFSTRQQYFMILLFAQATLQVPNSPDASVVAGSRALAEVWRDPLQNDQGVHPRVVRMFKILNSN